MNTILCSLSPDTIHVKVIVDTIETLVNQVIGYLESYGARARRHGTE